MPLSKIQDIGNQVVPNLGPRNVIINGAFNVAQRDNGGFTGLGGSSIYHLDRWKFSLNNTAGRFSSTQDSSAPIGFANSIKLDCTTADTSIASDEQFKLEQKIKELSK